MNGETCDKIDNLFFTNPETGLVTGVEYTSLTAEGLTPIVLVRRSVLLTRTNKAKQALAKLSLDIPRTDTIILLFAGELETLKIEELLNKTDLRSADLNEIIYRTSPTYYLEEQTTWRLNNAKSTAMPNVVNQVVRHLQQQNMTPNPTNLQIRNESINDLNTEMINLAALKILLSHAIPQIFGPIDIELAQPQYLVRALEREASGSSENSLMSTLVATDALYSPKIRAILLGKYELTDGQLNAFYTELNNWKIELAIMQNQKTKRFKKISPVSMKSETTNEFDLKSIYEIALMYGNYYSRLLELVETDNKDLGDVTIFLKSLQSELIKAAICSFKRLYPNNREIQEIEENGFGYNNLASILQGQKEALTKGPDTTDTQRALSNIREFEQIHTQLHNNNDIIYRTTSRHR